MYTLRTPVAALLFTALAGCASYTAMRPEAVPPSSTVRVQFESPQRVVVHAPNTDSTVIDEVVSVEGRMLDRTAEAVTLQVSSVRVRDPSGPPRTVRFSDGATAQIAAQTVERRRSNTGVVLVLLAITVVAIIVIGASYDPEPQPQPKTNTSTKA